VFRYRAAASEGRSNFVAWTSGWGECQMIERFRALGIHQAVQHLPELLARRAICQPFADQVTRADSEA
jgi:hypothetical protein